MIDKVGHVAWAAEATEFFKNIAARATSMRSQTSFATSDTWRMRAAPTFSTR